MKHYLVAVAQGHRVKTYRINAPDGYVPSSDDMLLLKKEIAEDEDAPRYTRTYAAPDSCGGSVSEVEYDKIPAEKINICAVSNLDL